MSDLQQWHTFLSTKVTHTKNLMEICLCSCRRHCWCPPHTLRNIFHAVPWKVLRIVSTCPQWYIYWLSSLLFSDSLLTVCPGITFWKDTLDTNLCLRLCFWGIQDIHAPNKYLIDPWSHPRENNNNKMYLLKIPIALLLRAHMCQALYL